MRLSRVYGLAARQMLLLTLEKFEDLTEYEKNELFMNSIQWYIVYPEELKAKGKRAAMKGISHSWRGSKTDLWRVWEKTEPLRDVQRLERRRLGKICHKVGISRVCSEQWVHAATPSVEWA
jgi:hypothetical protein